MTALNRSTHRRLLQLRQLPTVWEGDRRSLSARAQSFEEVQEECILWIDGTEAVVRAMDVVSADAGHEAIVRTLIRAMESPHSPALPGRPQKIVVANREIQFFLRGVLQDLEITVEYVQDLPLMDELFQSLHSVAGLRPPQLPPEYATALRDVALQLWQDEPWKLLDEEKIIAIHVNQAEAETLYVSVLGMLGMEYGLLMYRSLDSLKQFRQQLLQLEQSPKQLEEAFLAQDCMFLTFEQNDAEERLSALPNSHAGRSLHREAPELEPMFGNLHPLEGMRPILYEEEAIAALLALSALHRFFQKNHRQLAAGDFPKLTQRFRIPKPEDPEHRIQIQVETLPELAAELFDMTTEASLEDLQEAFLQSHPPLLNQDLIPDEVFFSLGAMPWDVVELLRLSTQHYQPADVEIPTKADGFPVVLLQTSRPKAIALIEAIQSAGGLKAIGFSPAEDPLVEQKYDLGILQTHDSGLHLFGEFEEDDPIHIKARQKWDQRCRKTRGYCGLVVARGLKGASRGNPEFKDMMALFEVRSLSAQDLGLGLLEILPQI